MMSPVRLLLLLLFAVGLVVLSLIMRQSGEAGIAESDPWLPGFSQHLADLHQIRVHSGSRSDALELIRDDPIWRVSQLDGYPADMSVLADLVSDLNQAHVVEPRTADPANHARVGLTDPRHHNEGGTLLLLSMANDAEYALLFGNAGPMGTVVRKAGESQSWLVDQRFDIPQEPIGWVDDLILNLPARDIEVVEFEGNDQQYRLLRDGDGQWRPDPLPEGVQPMAQPSLAQVAEAISGLRALDIAAFSRSGDEPETLATVTYRFSDGASVAVKRLYVGDTDWVRFVIQSSDVDEPLTDWDELSARLDGWRFQLHGFKLGSIFRTHETLLQAGEDD